MNHAEARSHMPDYLEGDLDLTRCALLDAHLDACEGCSQDFAEMRGTIALLRGLPDPEPPPFMAERVMARIQGGEGHRTVGDHLREFFGALATPQIALPATALGVGLLMATGVVDPTTISWEGFGERPSEALQQVTRADGGGQRQLASAWPPPAVARAPKVRIHLPAPTSASASDVDGLRSSSSPAQFASSEFGGPRPVTRWSPRSVRSSVLGSNLVGGGGGPLNLSVSNPVGLESRSAFSGSAFRARADASASGAGQRLDAMIRQPVLFAADFANRSITEQEAWLRSLALEAREQERGAEALASLRAVPDLRARQLATAMAAELRRLDHASVALLVPEEAPAPSAR